jgi:hypothetical protein
MTPFWAFFGTFYLIKLAQKPHFSKNARKTGGYRGVQKNVIFHVFLTFLQKNISESIEELDESWMRVDDVV